LILADRTCNLRSQPATKHLLDPARIGFA
jgi:hypothetical protein